jgi:HEAT repeat protein
VITPTQLAHTLLVPAFVLALATWAGTGLYLLLTSIASGRRALALGRARRTLAAIEIPDTNEGSLRSAMVSLVSMLPEDVVLPLAAASTSRPVLDRVLADATVARCGRSTLEAIVATPRAPKHNWRRIAAMCVLATASSPGSLVSLLRRALDDPDQEIVGASLAVLGRVPDMAAASALIEALQQGKYAPSRIATYLDQFPLPIGELLRPLLSHADPNARYWGATLLSRHESAGLQADLIQLSHDPSPLVRKAAVTSLGHIDRAASGPVARALLADQVWYVRAHAARALAAAVGADAADEIAPLLADREWWVRLAARESLQQMSEEIWSVLVPYLDHEDAFARNGAAEVLQNIGVLDSLIVMEAATSRPSASKVEMLRKIAAAGGTRMTEALLERVDDKARPRIRHLLASLGLEPTGVRS